MVIVLESSDTHVVPGDGGNALQRGRRPRSRIRSPHPPSKSPRRRVASPPGRFESPPRRATAPWQKKQDGKPDDDKGAGQQSRVRRSGLSWVDVPDAKAATTKSGHKAASKAKAKAGDERRGGWMVKCGILCDMILDGKWDEAEELARSYRLSARPDLNAQT